MNNYNQRGSVKRGHNNHNTFGMDPFSDMMDNFDDPFSNMMQEFRMPNFGRGFGSDFFGGGMRDFEQQIFSMNSGMGNGGTVISKSYVSKKKYNANGEPEDETYQSQSIQQIGKDGHKMKEKQEAYKNSRGIEKAAHQKMLDDKGQKCVKQRNRETGEQEQHNIYQGINEEEVNNFNEEYNAYRNKVNFQKNYELLNQGHLNMHKVIKDGNERNRDKKRNSHKPKYLPKGEGHH